MEDIDVYGDHSFLRGSPEQYLKRIGIEQTVRMEAKWCKSVEDILDNYAVLSKTADRVVPRKPDIYVPEEEFFSDYSSLTLATQFGHKDKYILFQTDQLKMVDFDVLNMNSLRNPPDIEQRELVLVEFADNNGRAISGYIHPYSLGMHTSTEIEPVFSNKLYKYSIAAYALCSDFTVIRDGNRVDRGPWLEVIRFIVDDRNGGRREPDYDPVGKITVPAQ